MNAIEIRGLRKEYGDVAAVDGLDLTVGEGEIFGLLGLNGAGKTTTVKILTGILRPTAGEALVFGEDVTKSKDYKQKINVSTQETAVAAGLTVRENMELMAEIYGLRGEELKDKCQTLIAEFGLEKLADRRAKVLSGGEARRLSVAMAMVNDPKLLFLDEPTLGLDVLSRRELWRAVENLRGRVTVVLTTHYLEEAEALCDRVAVMIGGSVRAIGAVPELLALTGTDSLENAFIALSDGAGKEA